MSEMPNPGSPQSMKQQPMPAMPKGTMIGMMFAMMIMLAITQFWEPVGMALNTVFQVMAFDGRYPVLTLILAGLTMITISTVIRSYMTDFVAQARNQHMSSELNKEMRKARIENNLYKLKKLEEQRPVVMAKSMEAQGQMMKVMPITMIVIIPIYAWVRYFLGTTVMAASPELLVINIPWGPVNLMESLWIMPIWIVVYTMISLPIGQLENRLIRYILIKKRLGEEPVEKV
ncbi:MAG: EMC3/TMCO1 family protein [Candidatus Methanoplasma sp.]|jgi:uncharacterized membrane protein (DUF106 family)|nr:EMC3/TMCO1 family protein [Candidatus Methanoplasma sp.]